MSETETETQEDGDGDERLIDDKFDLGKPHWEHLSKHGRAGLRPALAVHEAVIVSDQ